MITYLPLYAAPFWQFKVWARQATLMLIVLAPSLMGVDDAFVSAGSVNATDLTEAEHASLEHEKESKYAQLQVVRGVQTVATLVVIVGFAWWTWHIKPFHRRHQNWLEVWLVSSCAAVIILAFIYTLVVVQIGKKKALTLEICLTTTLILTTGSAAIYLSFHYRREVTRASKQALKRLSRSMAASRNSLARSASTWSSSGRGSSSRRSTQLRPSTLFGVISRHGHGGVPRAPSGRPTPPPLEHESRPAATGKRIVCDQLQESSIGATLQEPSSGATHEGLQCCACLHSEAEMTQSSLLAPPFSAPLVTCEQRDDAMHEHGMEEVRLGPSEFV